MRVLSVRQPWAWCIIYAGKSVENRTRSLGPYRGPVAIHASLQVAAEDAAVWEMDGYRDAFSRAAAGDRRRIDVRGAIIGVVDLVGVHTDLVGGRPEAHCSPWAEDGAHHLVLERPRALEQPLAWTGGLGLRKAPALDVDGNWLTLAGDRLTRLQEAIS